MSIWNRINQLRTKVWNDPVGSKVIANGITWGGPIVVFSVVAYVLNWWPTILSATFSSTPTPNWLLLLLSVSTLGLLVVIGRRAIRYKTQSKTTSPLYEWNEYREDKFFGSVWRWQYSDRGNVINIKCYCRGCNCEIIPGTQLGNAFLRCVNCGYYKELPHVDHRWESAIGRLIKLKIDNGDWKRIVELQKKTPPSAESLTG